MKRNFFTTLILLFALTWLEGCVVVLSSSKEGCKTSNISTSAISSTLGGKLFTSAWIQRSAEYQALCHQAYNIATERLEKHISSPTFKAERWAIVTDIDETILDNTPNAVHQALKGEDYTDASWDEWCAMAKADTLCGSREFFRRADAAGVAIFYISNRSEANRLGTLKNLELFGFPQVTNEHLLLRTTTSDKTARRDSVLRGYKIMMLIGDNLGDFDHIFDSSQEEVRTAGVKSMAYDFGKRFIVLPNPNYGTWEKAMNGGYPKLKEKDKKLPRLLRSH